MQWKQVLQWQPLAVSAPLFYSAFTGVGKRVSWRHKYRSMHTHHAVPDIYVIDDWIF